MPESLRDFDDVKLQILNALIFVWPTNMCMVEE